MKKIKFLMPAQKLNNNMMKSVFGGDCDNGNHSSGDCDSINWGGGDCGSYNYGGGDCRDHNYTETRV